MLHELFSDLLYRLRSLIRRDRAESELDDELRYHLERQAEIFRQAGMPPEEAMRQARLRFGGPEQIRQQCRESRGTGLLEDAVQDFRYGVRTLLKRPGFTVIVVLTLALGIGACTAIFSLMNVVLFPDEPFQTRGLVYLYTPYEPLNSIMVWPRTLPPSNADFFDIKRQSRSYAGVTQFVQKQYFLGAQSSGESVGGARVDASFFATLGVKPILGRLIGVEDCVAGHDTAVLISYRLWQEHFKGSPESVGQALQLDGHEYRIVGVMPEEFQYPAKTDLDEGDPHIATTDLWMPLVLPPKEAADRSGFASANNTFVLARLNSEISVKQAQAEMSSIMARLDALHPPPFQRWSAYVKPFQDTLAGTARPLMRLLFGAVLFVLLIACGNAANLILARGVSRTHELGMRATLGAGRGRLIRQMLAESLLPGVAGGVVGIGFAYCFLKLLLRLDPGNIPRLQKASLDLRVLAFTFVVTLFTSLLTGIIPALTSSRINLVEFLKSGGQRGMVGVRHRWNSGLMIAEVALVVVLLAGAGLLLRSYAKVETAPKGFSISTLSMDVALGPAYESTPQLLGFFHTLMERLNAIPGVQKAGVTDVLPFSNHDTAGTFWVQGYSNAKGQMIETLQLSPGYFAAMDTPVKEGRAFTEDDSAGKPEVAVINEAFAKKYFNGVDPIGRWVTQMQPDNPTQKLTGGKTIVGIVADVHHASIEQEPTPQLYLPLWQGGGINNGYIAIRSLLPPNEIVASARSVLHQIDPSLSFTEIHTMGELVSKSEARRRFQTTLLSAFAGMALFLALVGLYGLLAYSVRQRTPEIGVRLALGASRSGILRLVLQQGLRLVVTGLILGMTAAFALSRILSSLLYGVRAFDPLTFAGVAVLLLATAVSACLIPGWRAARVDPVQSLRYE